MSSLDVQSAMFDEDDDERSHLGLKDLSLPWHSLFHLSTRQHWSILVAAVLSSIATGTVGPWTAYLTGKIFDAFIAYTTEEGKVEMLVSSNARYIVYFVAVAVGSCIFRALESMLWLSFSELQANSVKNRLMSALLDKDIEWYDIYNKRRTGALLSRMNRHIRDLQLATAQPCSTLVAETTAAVVSMALAFAYSWELTLVILATVPLIVFTVGWIGARIQTHFETQQAALAAAQRTSSRALTAIDTVKCFNGQAQEIEGYSFHLRDAACSYSHIANLSALQMAITIFLTTTMCIEGFYYGAFLVSKGCKNGADIITTFLLIISAFQGLQSLFPQFIVLEKGRSAGASLRAIINESQNTNRSTSAVQRPTVCRGNIHLANLSFAYPSQPDGQVLRNVTMTIPDGQMFFLIGRSGSGKSTIGQLLAGIYHTAPGTIYFDGLPLEQLDSAWLRDNVTLVEQTTALFDGSLFYNIALGRSAIQHVTEREVIEGAAFARLQDVIADLPHGFETDIGHGGELLSGGQGQRVALARARLTDTPVLILDESTSALDLANRRMIMAAVRKWRIGRTTIIITHDLAQIEQNDLVFVLDEGEVVEAGCRCELESSPNARFQTFMRHARDDHARCPNETEVSSLTDGCENEQSSPSNIHMASPSPGAEYQTPQDQDAIHDEFSSPHNGYSSVMRRVVTNARRVVAQVRSRRGMLMDKQRVSDQEDILLQRLLPTKHTEGHSINGSDSISMTSICGSIWAFISPKDRIMLIFGFWSAIIHAAMTPAFSYTLSQLIQSYSDPTHTVSRADSLCLIILGITIVDTISTYLFRSLLERVGQAWVDSVRRQAFARLLTQPKSFFDRQDNAAARLIGCLDNAEEMRSLVGQFAAFGFVVIAITVFSLSWALVMSWKLTLLSISVVPFIWGTSKVFALVSQHWESQSNDSAERASVLFAEITSHIKTIRAFALEKHFQQRYELVTAQGLDVGLWRALYTGLCFGLSDSAGAFATAFIFYLGTRLAASGADVHEIIAVFAVLLFGIGQVGSLLAFIPQISQARDAASRLLRLARLPPDSYEHSGTIRLHEDNDIVFDGVNFAYPSRPETPVLRNLHLRLRPGTVTAIVGPSGSGKTTIANLLVKLYSIEPGRLTVGGHDLANIHTPSLRRRIVCVPQTPTVFALSIADNIAYGLAAHAPQRSRLAIQRAAERAGIHDFVCSLAHGYDTILSRRAAAPGAGGDGAGLSGGQAQRLAMARALLREPAVLVLDEPTAALDVVSAAHVRRALRRCVDGDGRSPSSANMCVVVITHAAEMMAMADRVVVLEHGTVVKEGSFESLMQRRGGALATLVSRGDARGD